MKKILKIKRIEGDEYNSSVLFTNNYRLYSEHGQDCCESHYLDFTMLKSYNIGSATGKSIDIYKQEFDFTDGVPFTKVEGVGILLHDIEGNKYLINGYGYNNGYYGTDITLILTKDGLIKKKYNVDECQEIFDN